MTYSPTQFPLSYQTPWLLLACDDAGGVFGESRNVDTIDATTPGVYIVTTLRPLGGGLQLYPQATCNGTPAPAFATVELTDASTVTVRTYDAAGALAASGFWLSIDVADGGES